MMNKNDALFALAQEEKVCPAWFGDAVQIANVSYIIGSLVAFGMYWMTGNMRESAILGVEMGAGSLALGYLFVFHGKV